MLNDLICRGFYSELLQYYKNNYYKIRNEPQKETKDFDAKLREYLELKPFELKLGKYKYSIKLMFLNLKSFVLCAQ